MTFGKKLALVIVASVVLAAPSVLTQSLIDDSAPAQEFDPSQMSDSEMLMFVSNLAKNTWTSFVHGWYSKVEDKRTFEINENCFGDYIAKDVYDI